MPSFIFSPVFSPKPIEPAKAAPVAAAADPVVVKPEPAVKPRSGRRSKHEPIAAAATEPADDAADEEAERERERVRARHPGGTELNGQPAGGQFIPNDPTTPENEAWIEV